MKDDDELFDNSKKLQSTESKTLLIDESKKVEPDVESNDDDEIAKEDERFVLPKNEKTDKPFGKKFKENIKKEQRLSKALRLKNKLTKGITAPKWIESFFKFLDFILNIFVIGTLVTAIVITIIYAMNANYLMVIAMCLFVFVIIYLSEKIS